MASFKTIQELLLPCLVEEIIDDEEFSVHSELGIRETVSRKQKFW